MEEANERSFDELLQEVQQQFMGYKESSEKRFQDLEELIDLAAQKMEILKKIKVQRRRVVEFDNVFPNSKTSTNSELEPHHLKLSFSKFLEGTGGADPVSLLKYKEPQSILMTTGKEGVTEYQEHPKFDEFPGEDKDDWHSQEIICIALGLEDFFQPKRNSEGNSCGTESLQVDSLDAYVFCKDSQENDPSSENGAQYRVLDDKENWHDMDTFSLVKISMEDTNTLLVENLFKEKFKKGAHASLLKEMKLIDIGVGVPSSTKEVEAANVLNPAILEETPPFMELDNLSRPFEAGQFECIKGKEQKPANENITSMTLTHMREMTEASLYKMTEDHLTATISYSCGKMSSNFSKNEVLIFDPGGYGLSGQQTCVVEMFIELMIYRKGGKLYEVAEINSICGKLGQLQLQEGIILEFLAVKPLLKDFPQLRSKVFEADIMNQYRTHEQGQPEMNKSMRFTHLEASRKSIIVYIFDPGGDSSCFHGVSVGNSDYLSLLYNVLIGKELYIKRKSTSVQVFSMMHEEITVIDLRALIIRLGGVMYMVERGINENSLVDKILMYYSLINAHEQNLKKLVLASYNDTLVHSKAGLLYLKQPRIFFEIHDPP